MVRVLGPERTLRDLGAPVVGYVVIFAAAAAAIPTVSGAFRDYYGSYRFTWLSVHPITAAALAGLALVFVVAEALFLPGGWARRKLGAPLWLYAPILLIVFLATRSRGPAVALVAALAALLLRRYGRRWMLPALGASIVTAMILLSSGPTIHSLMVTGATSSNPIAEFIFRGQPAEELTGLSGREMLWSGALVLFRERPILGHGYQDSREELLQVTRYGGHAHNALLGSLLDVGIVGTMLLWLAIAVCFCRSVLEGNRYSREEAWSRGVILGAVTFSLVNSLTDISFAGPASYETLVVLSCILVQEELRATGRARQ